MKNLIIIHHTVAGTSPFYQRVIKKDGRIVEQKNTWNFRNAEYQSYDIASDGDFTKETMTDAQKTALRSEIKRVLDTYPISEVIGHREAGLRGIATKSACPGTIPQQLEKPIKVLIINKTNKNIDGYLQYVREAGQGTIEFTDNGPADSEITIYDSTRYEWHYEGLIPKRVRIHTGGMNLTTYKGSVGIGDQGCWKRTPTAGGLCVLNGRVEDILWHEIDHVLQQETRQKDIHGDPLFDGYGGRAMNERGLQLYKEHYNPYKHFLVPRIFMEKITEQQARQFVRQFYFLTGLGLGDNEAIEYWVKIIVEKQYVGIAALTNQRFEDKKHEIKKV